MCYRVFVCVLIMFVFSNVSLAASKSWGKGQPYNGGYIAEKSGAGKLVSGNIDSKGYIDRRNHLHFHNDGVTVTHEGRKTTVFKNK